MTDNTLPTDNQVDTTTVQPPQQDVVPPVENEPVDNLPKTDVDTTDQKPDGVDTETPPEGDPVPTVEQLQAKLQEYELKEQERNQLKQRLSINDETPDELQLSTIEATIANRGQSEFISLCTKYGVDFTPEGIEKSAEALKERDPKAYYEFVYSSDRLKERIDSEQMQVHSTKINHEISNFYQANKPLIEASPVISKIVEGYIKENYSNMVNPTVELNNLVEGIKEIYLEALEAGKMLAKQETVSKDKSGLQTSIATDNTST